MVSPDRNIILLKKVGLLCKDQSGPRTLGDESDSHGKVPSDQATTRELTVGKLYFSPLCRRQSSDLLSILRSSTSKMSVAPPGIFGGAPRSP